MQSPFKNIDDIKNEFGIEEEDPSIIKKELIQRLAKLHPDKSSSNGDFSTPEQKEEFLRVESALDFINNEKTYNSEMIPVSDVTDLVRVIAESFPKKIDTSESQLSSQITTNINQIKTQFIAPKVIVSIIPALLTAIWMFPSTISEHPILKDIVQINSPIFQFLWFFSLLFTGGSWLILKKIEQQRKRFQLLLGTESFQNSIFEAFQKHTTENFTKDDFIDYLTDKRWLKKSHSNQEESLISYTIYDLIGPTSKFIDLEIANHLANIIFDRAEKRNIIEVDKTVHTLSEYYKFTN